MLPLRAKARKMGAKIMNKVQVVDLLKQGDRVVGAVGFNLIDNRFYVFKTKAAIIATAACGFNVVRMFNGCGDGIAAAYKAGAEMRNAEFANFYDIMRKDTGSAVYGAHEYIYNSAGENISKRYVTKPVPDISLVLRLGMEKEINEDRGPLCADVGEIERIWKSVAPKEGEMDGKIRLFPKKLDMMRRTKAKELKYGASPSPMPEVTLGLQAGTSPIKVDHEMRTSLAGLWAIGAVSYLGSAWSGAAPAPGMMRGSGLTYALLSALRGGPSAARFAVETAPPEVGYAETKQVKEDTFAPMRREKGVTASDVISAIQDVVCPVKYNLRRSKGRLEEALSRIMELQERLPELWAKDGHGLGKCREARSMALCAGMTFRAGLMRTESRGSHFREDFPKRDDQNWLKWIVIKQGAGGMELTAEPMPLDRYKVKP
jgi:succinate dehydrogenase/fumarate reductase flavoprotein subunit